MLSNCVKGGGFIEAEFTTSLELPLSLIDDFPEHPYRVRDDEDMLLLVESISKRGIITPAIVRRKQDGRFELIAGHRRKNACERLGIKGLRCEVWNLTDDEAVIIMVESNWQRTNTLPSEKAFAYKMWLDANKRQGQRTDLTCDPVGYKLKGSKTVSAIAEQTGDSKTQIQRYIRLTYLIPELLTYVDEGKIKLRPAVELSYLDTDFQYDVWEEIDYNLAMPSHEQAIRMRKMYQEGVLTTKEIQSVMREEKPNQHKKIVLSGERIERLIPKKVPQHQTEEYICRALKYYNNMLRKRAERESR